MRFAWGNETMILPDQKEATDNKTVQTLLSLLKAITKEQNTRSSQRLTFSLAKH